MTQDIILGERPQDQIDSAVQRLAGGYSALTACSLLSKRWHARQYQHRFVAAGSADVNDLNSWDWSPKESPTTLQYDPGSRHLWVTPSTLQGYCFKPFEPIESLTLDSISFAFFDANPPQESLRNLISSVRNLHILSPDARPGAILRFLSTFPSLQDVTIHAPRWTSDSGLDEVDEIGNVRISCSTLRISELDDQSNPFLSLLGSVPGAYEKVAVVKCNLLDVGPLQTLISQAGKTIRRLQIVIPSHSNAPVTSLNACEALEQFFVTVVGTDASFQPVKSAISSITSLRFRKFILEIQTTAPRRPDHVQIDLVERLSQLDVPLTWLARVALENQREISLTLLGQDPEFLAQGFMDFLSVGSIWAGEKVGEGKYFWSLAAPKNVARSRVNIINRLLGRRGAIN